MADRRCQISVRPSQPGKRVLLDVVPAGGVLVLAAGPASHRPRRGVAQWPAAVLAADGALLLARRCGEQFGLGRHLDRRVKAAGDLLLLVGECPVELGGDAFGAGLNKLVERNAGGRRGGVVHGRQYAAR